MTPRITEVGSYMHKLIYDGMKITALQCSIWQFLTNPSKWVSVDFTSHLKSSLIYPWQTIFLSQLSPSPHLFTTATIFYNFSTLNKGVFEGWVLLLLFVCLFVFTLFGALKFWAVPRMLGDGWMERGIEGGRNEGRERGRKGRMEKRRDGYMDA